LRLLERICRQENAELFALWTDHPDFTHPDFAIHS
jgi:hypothetical protein